MTGIDRHWPAEPQRLLLIGDTCIDRIRILGAANVLPKRSPAEGGVPFATDKRVRVDLRGEPDANDTACSGYKLR